ncbi:MAG: pilus assembly protein [Verrucomicrobia bacterium]|nr:pilus assembly protein [Verrucomicrobiota bacterium]
MMKPETKNLKPEWKRHRRAGAAMVEFVVGIVAVLVLFMGLLQIAQLARKRTRAMLEAQAEAGMYSMSDELIIALPGPQHIYDWDPGSDERPYSEDDSPILGSSAMINADIIRHARPDDLETYAGGNRISSLYHAPDFVTEIGLVHGEAKSENIPLYPIIQHLVYRDESIRFEEDVWLTWTKGIY